METRIDDKIDRHRKILVNISTGVIKNLTRTFHHKGFNWALISHAVTGSIECEIIQTLADFDEYSQGQESIFQSINLEELITNVTGKSGEISSGFFNTVNMDCTGLTRIYFDSLQFSMFNYNHDDNKLNLKLPVATLDKLTNGYNERSKQILSIFFSELVKLGTPDQVEFIWGEIQSKKHSPLIKLQQPRNPLTSWRYEADGDETTRSAVYYFNTVLDLQIKCFHYCNFIWPIITGSSKSIRKNFPEDVNKNIIRFFNAGETRKFIKGLPLVNKEISVACTEGHEKYKKLRR